MKKSLIWMVLIGIAMLVLFNGCVVGEKGNQPPVVELRTPANEATNQELDVVLEWNGQPGGGAARGSSLSILGYLVYFAVADQAYGVAEATQGNELEKAGLAYGTRYKRKHPRYWEFPWKRYWNLCGKAGKRDKPFFFQAFPIAVGLRRRKGNSRSGLRRTQETLVIA